MNLELQSNENIDIFMLLGITWRMRALSVRLQLQRDDCNMPAVN